MEADFHRWRDDVWSQHQFESGTIQAEIRGLKWVVGTVGALFTAQLVVGIAILGVLVK